MGSTLQAIRQYLLRELSGREIAFTANASGHTTSTVVDTDGSYFTTSGDFLTNYLIYAPAVATADNLRNISSFAAATGTYTITPVVSGASVWNSAAFEVSGYIDPKNTAPLLINDALKRILLMNCFNFAPIANSYEQDITSAASWCDNRSWVRTVALLGTGGDQQQTITESGSPGGGTFTVTYRGSQDFSTTTSAIAYDATAATLQTALRLIPDLAAVTVTRTGTTTNFVWVVTMTGADPYVPLFTASAASLTGGSSPAITPSITRDRGRLELLDGEAVKRGAKVYLQTSRRFLTTDRIYVWCTKPAYFECRATATSAFGSQSGLSGEAHECIPPPELVAFGALTILARRETNTISQAAQSSIAVQGPRWSSTFKKLNHEYWDTQRDARLDLTPILDFGPGTSSRNRNNHRVYWT